MGLQQSSKKQRGARLWPAIAVALLLVLGAARPAAAVGAHTGLHSGATRSQGYLGIGFHDVTPEQADVLHLRPGTAVEVVMVDHDGPAGQAGLKAHDVIVAMNGHAVAGATALGRWIHQAGAGAAVTLEVLRAGTRMTLHARLADRRQVERAAMQRLEQSDAPPPAAGSGFAESSTEEEDSGVSSAAAPDEGPPPELSRAQSFLNAMLHTGPFTGLAMEAMQPQLAGFFGAPGGMGLLVETVVPDSPAATAGLEAGDVVLRVDGMGLHAVSEWTRHLREVRGRPVVLVVLRQHRQQTLTLVPDLKHRSAVMLPALGAAAAKTVSA